MKFILEQRVIITHTGGVQEIGRISSPHTETLEATARYMREGRYWVYCESCDYYCLYDEKNISPLPGGQL